MNKIYKVLWSKVKHCYVVTSELAKRNGKGCGARSLRMAAVSVGVAAALLGGVGFGTPAAWADGASDNTLTVTSGKGSSVYGGKAGGFSDPGEGYRGGWSSNDADDASRNTVTINYATVNGRVYGGDTISGAASNNTVTVTGGTVNNRVFGGNSSSGAASNNTVTISGTVEDWVLGGYTYSGAATDNTVTISGGTVGGNVYGGMSDTGTANSNTITVTGGAIDSVHGGYSSAIANDNTVTVSGGTVGTSADNYAVVGAGNSGSSDTPLASGNNVTVAGTAQVTGLIIGATDAYGSADITDNTVTIDGSAVVTGDVIGGNGWGKDKTQNKVYVKGGAVTGNVYGGELWDDYYSSTGSATGNEVHISGGAVSGSVYGGAVKGKVTGNADSNTVEITGGEVKAAKSGDSVYGGYSDTGNADSNNVQVSGSSKVSIEVYGGVTKYTEGTANNNTVNVKDTAELADGITGGWSPNKDAKNNTITVDGGTVNGYISGGVAAGAAENNRIIVNEGGAVSYVEGGNGGNESIGNTVEVNGGKVTDTIFGGYSASGTVTDSEVTVNGGTVSTIYGGYSNDGTVTGSTITVSDAVFGAVYGGFAGGNANGNRVSITGGTAGGAIWGGYSRGGDAANNTVIVKELAAGRAIYGGYAANLAKNATGNTVSIKNVTAPAAYHNLEGGYTDYTAEPTGDFVTGNTLIINGTNKFGGVIDNFETIKLADDFAWKNGATVLQGKFGVNYDGTRPALDITDAEAALSSASSGTMTLLAAASGSVNEFFSTLKLKYSGGEETLNADNLSKVVKADGESASTENGVTITSASTHTVSLDKENSYKNVLYKVQNGVNGISFAAMDWNTGRAAVAGESFANVATVDAANLAFTDPENASGSMTLLSGATGLIADMEVTAADHTQNFTETLSNNVALDATLEGTVATLAGSVNYTVKDITVKSIDLDNWNGEGAAITSGWKAAGGGLAVTAADFTDPILAAGQASQDIVTTDTEGFFGSVTGDKAYTSSDLDLDAGNGVSVKGLQASGVKAEDSGKKLTYYAATKAVNSIDVSGWAGTDAATTADLTGWALADGLAVNTNGMAVPGTMNPGDSATLLEAIGADFTGIAVTGAYAWQNAGNLDTAPVNGVSVIGTSTGGGVKGDGTAIIYQKSKNAITSLTLGEVTFADNGTARSFGADDDLSAATINADGLSFSKANSMSGGQSMTIVDATGALDATAIGGFADKKYETTFNDKVTDSLTIQGAQTDWLKQDGGTKLVYTVGDRMVTNSTMSGDLAWSDDVTHYTNTNYKFDENSNVNVGVNFTSATDPLAGATRSMTLLKNAAGAVASNVTGTPTFAVTLDQNNTTLNASASGTLALNGNDVKYTVTGVVLDTVTVKSVGNTADTAPTNWTLAEGATVETDSMAVPEVAAGNHKDILKSNTDNFFANVTINGANAYTKSTFDETDSGITFNVTQSKGVTLNEAKNHIIYEAGTKDVNTATLAGEIAWDTSNAYYTNKQYTFTDSSKVGFTNDAVFTSTTDPQNQSMTLIKPDSDEHAVKGTLSGSPGFIVKLENTTLEATATGSATIAEGNLQYSVTDMTLDKVTVNSTGSDVVPEGWNVAADMTVDASIMQVASDVKAGEEAIILKANSTGKFTDDSISDSSNKYGKNADREFTETDAIQRAVTIKGTQDKGVKANSAGDLVYAVGKKEVKDVSFGAVNWQKGATLFDGSSATEYDYSNVASIGTDKFDVTYAEGEPQTITAGDSMTLLKANDTLQAIVNEEKTKAYSFTPVSGVTVDAAITGKLANSGSHIVFTAAENQASKLTFGDVEWKDSGALVTRPKNITFAGADVDTTKINFTNVIYLDADQQMTLVSDFGDTVGTVTGSKYMVGTAFEGEGAASLSGGNLVFRTKTGAGVSEQTHKTVMAADAGVTMLNVGNEYIGKAMEGMGDMANVAPDGSTVGAAIGGGKNRYETGSHVNVNSWNAAVAVGAKRNVKGGSLEYGVFGEYGKADYTLHSDAGRGDGDAHYAGGGLLAKWTNRHDVYTEASFRLGRLSESSGDIMRDGLGNRYGYDVHANYYGAHVGVGKIFRYDGGRSLDVYGKYFYTKRDGVEFDAPQHYDLDSVASSVLRIGARYGTTDKKWNWYGGLAYEYEFDGEAEGSVNGTAIRAASIQGSSVRAEFGMRMNATKTNPWQTDISLYGYGGKHRGIGGNVSVAYMF